MEGGLGASALLKIVGEYGVLGLGWVAWILTMFYLQVERKRYQALVIHIVAYFTKVNMAQRHEAQEDDDRNDSAEDDGSYASVVGRLLEQSFGSSHGGRIRPPGGTRRTRRTSRD